MTTENQIHSAIDSISESVRINGCESKVTDFLINFLAGNVHLILDQMDDAELAEDDD